jgi:putative phosphoesterase
MRLAVISDIHSNFSALEAVIIDLQAQSPDIIVVAGDFINRGPQPRQVWEALCETGWPILRGNHEDYVIAQYEEFGPEHPLANPLWQPARWTSQQLGPIGAELEALPLSLELEAPDGSAVTILHGTARRNNEGIFAQTPDEDMPELIGENPAPLFCCGHTHAPLIRHYGQTLIVNCGSVGLPFNGDPRAQYALIDWRENVWHPAIHTVPYDRTKIREAFEADFFQGGGPLTRVIWHEVETARPHLGRWIRDWADPVREGRTTIDHAVTEYLRQEATRND